jgi:hypothetical protein
LQFVDRGDDPLPDDLPLDITVGEERVRAWAAWKAASSPCCFIIR